jgi:hypothetical protein
MRIIPLIGLPAVEAVGLRSSWRRAPWSGLHNGLGIVTALEAVGVRRSWRIVPWNGLHEVLRTTEEARVMRGRLQITPLSVIVPWSGVREVLGIVTALEAVRGSWRIVPLNGLREELGTADKARVVRVTSLNGRHRGNMPACLSGGARLLMATVVMTRLVILGLRFLRRTVSFTPSR